MKRLAVAVGILFLISASGSAQEVPNPFTAKGAKPPTGLFHAATSGFTAALAIGMAPVQRSLNDSLAGITRSLEGSRSLGGLLLVSCKRQYA